MTMTKIPRPAAQLVGLERLVVASVGLGNLAVAVALTLDRSSSLVVEGWEVLSPLLFYVSGATVLLWAARPGNAHYYAASIAASMTAYIARAILSAVTLWQGTPVPWSVRVAIVVWLSLAGLVFLAWRRLAPHRPDRGECA